MILSEKQIKEIIDNTKPATRGNLVGDCPFCYKEGHFYINKGHGRKGQPNGWDCKKCSLNGNVYSLLRMLNLQHLIEGDIVDITKKLNLIENVDQVELDLIVPDVKLPFGFKRVFHDRYLCEERGFDEKDFNKYIIGRTDSLFKYQHYTIIAVIEDGRCKGFVGRLNLSKSEIDRYNKGKDKKERLKRYLNSKKSNFSKLLLGFDEIDIFTKTAIIVEGYFDKRALDRVLELDYQSEIKALCSFGKKVSPEQAYKLLFKGIENVILIQDPDAINETKKTAGFLSTLFDRVLVGFTHDGDLDESSEDEIKAVFDNLLTPNEFNHNVVQIRKL